MLMKIIVGIATTLFLINLISCVHKTPPFVKDSIVQVWRPDSNGGAAVFEALGVAVGDGTTILTVINYEDYSPGEFTVISPKLGKSTATILSIDSRTGATLLKLNKGKLPAVATRDAATLSDSENLTLIVATGSDAAPLLAEVPVRKMALNRSTLIFYVFIPPSTPEIGYNGITTQGAVVTDASGAVLGLESVFDNRLVTRAGGPDTIAAIINIEIALQALSPDANNQPWANGPFIFAANMSGSMSGNFIGMVKNYNEIANSVTHVLSELGGQLSITDLPHNFISYAENNQVTTLSDGSLFTTVFPRPVALRDSAGTVLAHAKWVGIQWDRNGGKLNRVIYGSTAYNVQGSFAITGDVSSLAAAVRALLIDQNPYGP
jgi:hypothetical protein